MIPQSLLVSTTPSIVYTTRQSGKDLDNASNSRSTSRTEQKRTLRLCQGKEPDAMMRKKRKSSFLACLDLGESECFLFEKSIYLTARHRWRVVANVTYEYPPSPNDACNRNTTYTREGPWLFNSTFQAIRRSEAELDESFRRSITFQLRGPPPRRDLPVTLGSQHSGSATRARVIPLMIVSLGVGVLVLLM
jgi:hypothetical protein